jgi:hypothetical protein
MNDLIKEFARQSGFKVNWQHEDIQAIKMAQYKEFAELIVLECMRMCDVAAVGYDTHNHIKEANGCCSAKEYIAEHFGVEE